MEEKLYITAQGRLPASMTRSQRRALGAYAILFSQLERKYIAASCARREIDKSEWLKEHKITGRQFNAIKRSAEGKMDSQLSNLQGYLIKQVSKIRNLERTRVNVQTSIKAWKKIPQGERREQMLDELYLKLRGVDAGLGKAKARKTELEEQIKAKRPRICLGSRKLFYSQFNLKENGFQNHEEWRDEWQRVRRSQFFVIGSKDEAMGCQGCVMTLQDDGRLTVRIRMPRELEQEHGKYLTISDIKIGYEAKTLKVANALNLKRRGRLNSTLEVDEPSQEALDRNGLAVNYRFIRDAERGWRVLISMEKPDLPEVTTDVARGAIGVDLNKDHLAVSEIDHQGNHVRSWDVPLPRGLQATSRQNRTAIETTTKELVRYAKEVGKPLVIEKLDFAAKKAALQKRRNAKYNAMLSSFSYRLFEQALTRQGLLAGVQVRQVNPAWTSFIGQLKYLNQTRGHGHQAAALAIARRGRGHRDRLPKQSRQTLRCGEARTFDVPVDRLKDRYDFAKAKRELDKWFTAQIRELRLRLEGSLLLREQAAGESCRSRTVSRMDEDFSLIPY